MNRREFLCSVAWRVWAAAIAVVIPSVSIAQTRTNRSSEITNLWAAIQIDLLFKNFESARQHALQLIPYARDDPNWFNYGDSFNIVSVLFKLTPKSDRGAWLFAAHGLLECYPGMKEGDIVGNYRTVASAAYGLIEADANSRIDMPKGDLARVASLLLVVSAVAPGSERQTWALAARRGIQRYGGEPLAEWSSDGLTPRLAAAGVAMSGDWKAASTDYERILLSGKGALDHLLPVEAKSMATGNIDRVIHTPGSSVGGLSAAITGATALQSEAATTLAMAGRVDRAIELLEMARRKTLALRKTGETSSARSPVPAALLESKLASAGVVVVQPVASLLGAFVLLSVRRGKTVQRFIAFSAEHGGFELSARLIDGGSLHFSKDGLIPAYEHVSKSRGKDRTKKLIGYSARAAAEAEILIGSTIRNVLRQAKITGNADVLVILPADLAVLPIGLAADPRGQSLSREFQVRYADSLTTAAACLDRVKGYARVSPTVEVLGADPGSSNLPFAAFERDCVTAAFNRDLGTSSTAGITFSWPDRGGYWHVASHASWNFGDPRKSGILIGKKQVITVDDILKLSLGRPPRLVFLSACETALINVKEDVDRFVGLPTAFLSVGAGGVIASQWPVSDAASALFAVRFYDEHLGLGRSPALALANAQRWLADTSASDFQTYIASKVESGKVRRESAAALSDYLVSLDATAKPFEAPYYWGGYQLYGA